MEEVVRGDVDGADDPLAALSEVEDVDASRRLLEVAEEHPLAGERVGQDRPVHASVEDCQRGLPVVRGDDRLHSREDAVEELPDRLAAEEPRVVRDDATERVDELVVERVRRNLGEATALDLAELGP